MKFSCLLSNPPFQDSSHDEKKNTLWRKWLNFKNVLVEANGVFSLVIPSSWMGSPPVLKEFFFEDSKLEENITHINRDECRKHFPGIGSTFSYFVLSRERYNNRTEVVSKNIDKTCEVSKDVDLNRCIIEVFPRDLSELGLSIMNKALDSAIPKLGIINNTYNHSVHKKKWSKIQSEDFCYPIQNTPNKLYWYNYAHPDQDKLKLLIPTTTYFRNQMVTTNGVTQSFCYFLITDDLNQEIVSNNINNKLFDYLNECFRYANWNSVKLLRKLPKIPLDRFMNDHEIYEYFKLTQNEIEHINKLITWR